MKTTALYFDGKKNVYHQDHELRPPQADEVVVKTCYSAISAGTEKLFYRGEVPDEMSVDESLENQQQKIEYPLKYGYSVVGEIIESGSNISEKYIGKRVFAFYPHQNLFNIKFSEMIFIPDTVDFEDAVILPNVETALNLVMDTRPVICEKGMVIGCGVVGILTMALLAQFPLASLEIIDLHPGRLAKADHFIKQIPGDAACPVICTAYSEKMKNNHADFILELSGNPDGFNYAIKAAGFESRIVVGSWYGKKTAPLNLGGNYHRNRVKIYSSQVSSINSEFTGRWDKKRRFEVCWKMIKKIKPSRLITEIVDFKNAGRAFQLLDENPDENLQMVLKYSD